MEKKKRKGDEKGELSKTSNKKKKTFCRSKNIEEVEKEKETWS
jgi:hypothetical protein